MLVFAQGTTEPNTTPPAPPTTDWTIVLAAAAFGAASVAAAFFAGLKDVVVALFRKLAQTVERGKKKHTDGVRQIAAVMECLQQMGDLTGVDRAIVFTGTNCGGVPDSKKPYVVRPLYRWPLMMSSDPSRSPEVVYRSELLADAHYMKTVCELLEKQWLEVRKADLPEGVMMKRYLNTEGVYQSRLYVLHVSATQLTFASVASYQRDFTGDETDRINIFIDRIRAVMAMGE